MQACTICSPALGAAAASDTQWPRQAWMPCQSAHQKYTTAQTHLSSYPARTQLKNLQFMAKEREGQLFSFSTDLVGVRYQALQRLHLLVDLAPPPLRPEVNQIKQRSLALAQRTQSTQQEENLRFCETGSGGSTFSERLCTSAARLRLLPDPPRCRAGSGSDPPASLSPTPPASSP